MLRKVRIEVECGSADEAVAELAKYEHALQAAEAERYALDSTAGSTFANWGVSVNQRSFYNEELGRDVVDELIEYDSNASHPDTPVYKARRSVRYIRIDLRGRESAVPPPRVVDHWEDRTTYPDPAGPRKATGYRDDVVPVKVDREAGGP